MRKLLSFVGGLAALLTVVMYLALFVNAIYPFMPVDISTFLTNIRTYAALVVVAITGLEFVWIKKFGLFVLIYLVFIAAIVIFMFFPEVLATIIV